MRIVVCPGILSILGQRFVLTDFSNISSPFMKLFFAFKVMTAVLSKVAPLGKRFATWISLQPLFGLRTFHIVFETLLIRLHKQDATPLQMILEGCDGAGPGPFGTRWIGFLLIQVIIKVKLSSFESHRSQACCQYSRSRFLLPANTVSSLRWR